MFKDALWESRSHATKNRKPALLTMLFSLFIAVALFLSFINLMVGIILLVLSIVAIIPCMPFLLKYKRWYNPKNIFAFTEEGIFFTKIDTPRTCFYDYYSNISGYSYIEEFDNYATVTIYFKKLSHAGSYGYLKELRMVKIENFVQLKTILEARNIYQVKGA